jgi:hypothetical protein
MFLLLLKSMPFLALLSLPMIEAGGIAYYLRSSLSRPWLFAVSSVVAVYFLLGFAAYRDLAHVGFSGNPSNEPPDSGLFLFGVGAAYLVITFAAIWGFSYLFRRAA